MLLLQRTLNFADYMYLLDLTIHASVLIKINTFQWIDITIAT